MGFHIGESTLDQLGSMLDADFIVDNVQLGVRGACKNGRIVDTWGGIVTVWRVDQRWWIETSVRFSRWDGVHLKGLNFVRLYQMNVCTRYMFVLNWTSFLLPFLQKFFKLFLKEKVLRTFKTNKKFDSIRTKKNKL